MTAVIADLIVDVHPAIDKLTLFLYDNSFLAGSTDTVYLVWQIVLSMMVDGGINWLRNTLHDCLSSRFGIAFAGI